MPSSLREASALRNPVKRSCSVRSSVMGFPLSSHANKAGVKLANFTCPARILPLYSCAGKSGNRQETVAAACVIGEEMRVPSDTRPVQHYRHYASSVIRSLRSVMTLRRALLAQTESHKKVLGDCRFSIGSAPLTSIKESDAQISGGETRQDYKDPRRFPLVAPSCALLFLPFGAPVSFRCYGRVCLIPRLTLSSG